MSGENEGMSEARVSWNMRYMNREGFDMMVTLRDQDEAALSERVARVVAGIIKAGGVPLKGPRPAREAVEAKPGGGSASRDKADGKTYLDENNVRRCNQRTLEGHRCDAIVTEREGKYGPFWACPRYKEHAK